MHYGHSPEQATKITKSERDLMISPKFLEHKTALKRASNPSAKAPKPKHVKPKKALKLITFREKLDNAQVTLARQIIQTQHRSYEVHPQDLLFTANRKYFRAVTVQFPY
jgi:hypothetical protein